MGWRVFQSSRYMDNLFLKRVNSWQGLVKKEQGLIFRKSISLPNELQFLLRYDFGPRLFFLTIPKPLKQHPF